MQPVKNLDRELIAHLYSAEAEMLLNKNINRHEWQKNAALEFFKTKTDEFRKKLRVDSLDHFDSIRSFALVRAKVYYDQFKHSKQIRYVIHLIPKFGDPIWLRIVNYSILSSKQAELLEKLLEKGVTMKECASINAYTPYVNNIKDSEIFDQLGIFPTIDADHTTYVMEAITILQVPMMEVANLLSPYFQNTDKYVTITKAVIIEIIKVLQIQVKDSAVENQNLGLIENVGVLDAHLATVNTEIVRILLSFFNVLIYTLSETTTQPAIEHHKADPNPVPLDAVTVGKYLNLSRSQLTIVNDETSLLLHVAEKAAKTNQQTPSATSISPLEKELLRSIYIDVPRVTCNLRDGARERVKTNINIGFNLVVNDIEDTKVKHLTISELWTHMFNAVRADIDESVKRYMPLINDAYSENSTKREIYELLLDLHNDATEIFSRIFYSFDTFEYNAEQIQMIFHYLGWSQTTNQILAVIITVSEFCMYNTYVYKCSILKRFFLYTNNTRQWEVAPMLSRKPTMKWTELLITAMTSCDIYLILRILVSIKNPKSPTVLSICEMRRWAKFK